MTYVSRLRQGGYKRKAAPGVFCIIYPARRLSRGCGINFDVAAVQYDSRSKIPKHSEVLAIMHPRDFWVYCARFGEPNLFQEFVGSALAKHLSAVEEQNQKQFKVSEHSTAVVITCQAASDSIRKVLAYRPA